MPFERVDPPDNRPERNVMPGGPLPSQLHIGNTSTTGGSQAFVGINNISNGSIQCTRPEDPQQAFQDKVDSCRNALFLTNPYVDRESLISSKGKRTVGTCEWIKDNDVYRSWLQGGSQLLWISGGPGKGKTVLSIFLTEEFERFCQDSENALLLFYFCTHQDEKRNNAVAILRGLLHQLLTKCPNLAKHVLPSFESPEIAKNTLSSVHALWIIFRKLLQDPNLGTVFCVLDGLDECDDESSKKLVTKFIHFFSSDTSDRTDTRFKLVIVSRPGIARLNAFPRVKLDPDNDGLVNNDIELFISARVMEFSSIEGFSDAFRNDVKNTLLNQAEGTFLWVGFVMEELSRKRTYTEVQDALGTIPKGLHAIFSRMLLEISRIRRRNTALILRWVTFAVRPLTLQELVAATGIQSSPSLNAEQAARDEIALYGSFLKILEDKVTFVHQSAKEYLLQIDHDSHPEFWIKPEEAHLELTRTCLDLIENSALQCRSLDSKDSSSWQDSPLLDYAVFHWMDHARSSSTYAKELLNQSRPFVKDESDIWKKWLKAYSSDYTEDSPYILLHIASYFSIVPWVQHLLKKRTWRLSLQNRADAKDKQRRTALMWAASGGQVAVVQLLLNHGANINAKDRFGRTALTFAAIGGHKEIVQLLLDYRADANSSTEMKERALMSAADFGYKEIVQLLLDRGTRVNARGSEDRETVLMCAVCGEDKEVVQLLLDHGADINAKDKHGWTALIFAAERGYEKTVQLLLNHGADVNAKDRYGWTALTFAAEGGHKEVAQLLLDHNNNAIANENRALV
ncbi:ankyrin repeat-containing domain protein [Xylaria scruposa]|nr:ankyrin repeat-containing domain protein [Xylaria scruposa]